MMKLMAQRLTKKPGSSPGKIELVGEKKIDKPRIRLFRFHEKEYVEQEFQSLEECLLHKKEVGVKWINVDGLHEVDLLKNIGDSFGLHPLVLEDIANTTQRPKVEFYDQYIYVVLKMFYFEEESGEITSEQMSFILGKDYVLSFQERVGDVFEQVRKRIRFSETGRIRKSGGDYLLYALLDAIVDHYFLILEKLADRLEDLDEELNQSTNREILRKLNLLKKEIILLRKLTWPLREVFNSFGRNETKLIKKETHLFMRDVYDHVVEVLDTLEGFREMLIGLNEMYQSNVSNKMNEVMKVLTIIATLFIPPTFIAGIYGMNFDYMPELHTKFGYFLALSLMFTSIFSMLLFFKKRKWF